MPTATDEPPTRKKTAQCPECGEFFSPQGLKGHLRYQHQLGGEAAVMAKAADEGQQRTFPEKAARNVQLVTQLRAIRREREALEQALAGAPGANDSLFKPEPDPVLVDCIHSLRQREVELVNEIRRLDGRPTVELRTERSFWNGDRLVIRERPAEAEPDTD